MEKIKSIINSSLFKTAVCLIISIALVLEGHLLYSGLALGVGLREFLLAFAKNIE
jgi:hypothetical protein